jgi:hypothetical protein
MRDRVIGTAMLLIYLGHIWFLHWLTKPRSI